MKKIKIALKSLIVVSSIFAFSCSSTKIDETLEEAQNEIDSAKDISIDNNHKKDNEDFQTIFLEAIDGLEITIAETPKEAIKNKPFATPFVLKIKKNKNSVPLSKVWIAIKYPISRNKETFEPIYEVFHTVPIETTSDTEGFVEFIPPVPTTAFNEKITFIPCVSKENTVKEGTFDELYKIAEENVVTADYKVKTDMRSAGGVISLVEFKKDGKPLYSDSIASSKLLMNLLKLGFSKVGNDDYVNEILNGNNKNLFEATKKYNGTLGYLIFGTVKNQTSTNPETQNMINLIGEVACMNLKATSTNDLIFFKTIQTASEKDLATAREALAKKIADAINYGM